MKSQKSTFVCPHQELNPNFSLRTGTFYPLNYGGKLENSKFEYRSSKHFKNLSLEFVSDFGFRTSGLFHL